MQVANDPRASLSARPLTGADIISLTKRQTGMNRLVSTFSPRHAHLTPKVS